MISLLSLLLRFTNLAADRASSQRPWEVQDPCSFEKCPKYERLVLRRILSTWSLSDSAGKGVVKLRLTGKFCPWTCMHTLLPYVLLLSFELRAAVPTSVTGRDGTVKESLLACANPSQDIPFTSVLQNSLNIKALCQMKGHKNHLLFALKIRSVKERKTERKKETHDFNINEKLVSPSSARFHHQELNLPRRACRPDSRA